ncbi:Arylamine N-acetyltransferase [Penicillium sp. IBT 35674x]|nr:Arylamine N-acetyltransferase [Penicillium sp. IBT 35674x]
MGSIIDWSLRPVYSPEQLERYFERIDLPQKYRESPVVRLGASVDSESALGFLKVLQRYQLAAVPFENLNLHYAVNRCISIDAQELFEKIVDSGSDRGGYCMENSTLFGTVLRTMGYNVTSVGGRVNEAVQPISTSKDWKGPKYDGWNHLVNIVAIGEQRYLIDVGFGSSGPHQPVPLIDGFKAHNVGDQHARLIYGHIAQHTGSGQSLWQYEICNGGGAWIPAYCFTETEFLPEDFTIINYYMSTSPESWFVSHVVCVRMILDDEGEKVIGDLTLFDNTLKRRLGATSEVLQSLATEEERMDVLQKYFHIPVSKADKDSILRTASRIM